MADNFLTPSNTIDMRLPQMPETKDPELFRELSIIYTALRQLQNGTDKYLDVPNSDYKTAAYTINYLDRGQCIETSANVTIPSEASAGTVFPLGMIVSIGNTSNASITIVAGSGVTLVLGGTTTTGNRTVANWGMAVVKRISKDVWRVYGAGVT
jgi:hypothetical protein